MPGSREGEVKLLLPEMLSAIRVMADKDSELTFHLALANDTLLGWSQQQVQGMTIGISMGDAHQRMAQADLVLVASGTATLEVALVGVPMVVIYKLSGFSYFIASRLVKSKYVSLPNVIADKSLVPELIQEYANGENIARHAMRIISSDNRTLIKEFNAIHTQLKHNAADESARAIIEFINE
jgi:Lipid A disaccharide synthetase